ncbi:MAG: putative metal-binding motif-containing protein [Bradymonadaceae bacterium]
MRPRRSLSLLVILAMAGCAVGEFPGQEGDTLFLDDVEHYTDAQIDTDAYSLIPDALGPPDTCPGPACPTNNTHCPAGSCIVGALQCTSSSQVRACIADSNGCGGWTASVTCADGGSCENDACQECVDLDGDGRGEGCALGADCDDDDPTVYEGAAEQCNGKDNNCDGTVDSGFNVGQACHAGTGECRREGQFVCTADGTGTTCNASAGQPTTEVCDGKDNNCNGTIDSGNVCNTCVDDQYEPNNSSLNGTPLAAGQSLSMMMCPDDNTDWFQLGSHTQGQTVFVEILFNQADGDLDMEMYVGGSFAASATSNTSNESITHTLTQSGRVDVWVRYKLSFTNRPVTGTPYTIRR